MKIQGQLELTEKKQGTKQNRNIQLVCLLLPQKRYYQFLVSMVMFGSLIIPT